MGIACVKTFVETICWDSITWESIDREKAEEYVKDHELPTNHIYPTKEMVLWEIRKASGVISLPSNAPDSLVSYFRDLIEECL
jgi:hypothetical protein